MNLVDFQGNSIVFIGNYLPRQCGIATFTHDLCEAVAAEVADKTPVFAVAMNDRPDGYAYPHRVHFEIRQNSQNDYRLAAEYLNMQQPAAICLQHEYGIFGGPYGSHILSLLRRLRRPLITTLHTVLESPSEQQKLILQEITRLSTRVVVMAEMGKKFLEDVFHVPAEKIAVIPHGIPDVPFVDPHFFKDQFGVEGKKVMLTFGLLSPGKGLEYAIEAMPAIVKKHPELVYIILGATHPHVKAEYGEEYRNGLTRRVNELGVRDNVIFVNRFVVLKELCEYLGAAELYVTPYLNEAQMTSGTLAYAMGTGKAIVSTPYWHAREVLADGRGTLVPFRNSQAVADAVNNLLDNENELNAMRKNGYNYCRRMIWPCVAESYLNLFTQAGEAWQEDQRTAKRHGDIKPRRREKFDLPEIDLKHMQLMTDDTGIIQHCVYITPDRYEGYCVDDNARALIVAGMNWQLLKDESVIPMMNTYLSFLYYSQDKKSGRFRNFMNYDRTWRDEKPSEDAHGRAMWALGEAVANCPHESMIALASRMFQVGLGSVKSFTSPRAWAFTLCGIHAYLRRFSGDSRIRRHRAALSQKLFDLFRLNVTEDWRWCEDIVAYASAKLPHVLMMSGRWMQRGDMVDLGRRALGWLIDIQTNDDGFFSFIGSDGWYRRGHKKAHYAQQPIEAHAMLDACIEAFHITHENYWIDQAQKAFYWFLGENDLRRNLYDFTTGGCRDGLQADGVNENQGAESTLAWLMSLQQMHALQEELSLAEIAAEQNDDSPNGLAVKTE